MTVCKDVRGAAEWCGIDHSKMLADLSSMPPGAYDVSASTPWWWRLRPSVRSGWISVDMEKGGGVAVMWTTDKDTHWPLGRFGGALAVTIRGGRLISYMESAWSLWLKWGYGRGGDAELKRAMDFVAFAHNRLTACRGVSA